MTVNIDIEELPAQLSKLFQHVREGEEIAILEGGVVIARLVPPSPLAELQHIPSRNAAEAFRGRVGAVKDDDIPIDLARNDEQYFAELMAERPTDKEC
jgi:antitoxin (DNA-binding transcriptional repressor) of toxin-antitoxin stability system